MVTVTLFIIATIVSFALIILGVSLKENQHFGQSAIAGFILLLITGIILLMSPLTYVTGQNVITNNNYENITGVNNSSTVLMTNNNQTSTNIYTSDNSVLSYVLSLLYILIGIAGLIMMSQFYWERKNERVENE